MLSITDYENLDDLIKAVVPDNISFTGDMTIPNGVSEFEILKLLKNISQNLEQQNEQVIEVAQIRIDKNTRIVTYKGDEVPLTKMEFDLLVLLAEKPGRAYSRDEILNKVWGFENFPTTRTVDTHVLQLRNKFSDELIETVRGVGYRFQKQN